MTTPAQHVPLEKAAPFLGRSRSAQSTSMLFNIRFYEASTDIVAKPTLLELSDLTTLTVDPNAHTLDLSPRVRYPAWPAL